MYFKLLAGEEGVIINGNGSEICRNFYDKHCRRDPNAISSRDLVRLFGYSSVPPYSPGEIEKWPKSLEPRLLEGVNTLDLPYHGAEAEQLGAQYPAEQDVVVEELSPFNCRTLIEIARFSPPHAGGA